MQNGIMCTYGISKTSKTSQINKITTLLEAGTVVMNYITTYCLLTQQQRTIPYLLSLQLPHTYQYPIEEEVVFSFVVDQQHFYTWNESLHQYPCKMFHYYKSYQKDIMKSIGQKLDFKVIKYVKQQILNNQIMEDKMDGACNMHGRCNYIQNSSQKT